MRTFYSEKLGFPKGWNSGAAQSQPGANPSALAPPAVVPPTANSAANDQPPFCERELTGTDWQIDKLIRKSAQINSHVNGNAKLLHDVSLLLPPPPKPGMNQFCEAAVKHAKKHSTNSAIYACFDLRNYRKSFYKLHKCATREKAAFCIQ